MSDELKGAIITAIVTGIISIIGFVVTYNSMKKNFKNELEKENYEKSGTDHFEKYRAISLYTLLATQIKYDVTGIAVSPEFWLQMKLNDYSANKSEFKKANNLIVKELNLKSEFKIK